jgi:hypothetical protein
MLDNAAIFEAGGEAGPAGGMEVGPITDSGSPALLMIQGRKPPQHASFSLGVLVIVT